MKNLVSITLGVMTALGGFVDVGQLVFTMQAGALFGYRLGWSVVLGTIGIIVFLEMSGRIAAGARLHVPAAAHRDDRQQPPHRRGQPTPVRRLRAQRHHQRQPDHLAPSRQYKPGPQGKQLRLRLRYRIPEAV